LCSFTLSIFVLPIVFNNFLNNKDKTVRVRRYSYVRQLLEERPEAASTSALTQIIIRNAVTLAKRCVADMAGAKQGRMKTKTRRSHTIVEKFLNQVRDHVHDDDIKPFLRLQIYNIHDC